MHAGADADNAPGRKPLCLRRRSALFVPRDAGGAAERRQTQRREDGDRIPDPGSAAYPSPCRGWREGVRRRLEQWCGSRSTEHARACAHDRWADRHPIGPRQGTRVAVTLPTAPPLLWMDGGVRERHSARLDD